MAPSAKALLDSLMGPSRNLSASQRTGEDFKEDNICKCFLVGFCPAQLLSKHVETVESCKLLHSVACKEELEKHPSSSKFKRDYEAQLTKKLEEICAEADTKAGKERRKIRPSETVVKLPDHLKIKIQCYEEARSARLKEADDRGRAGDIQGSQLAMASATQATKDIEGINQAHTSTFPGEDVCKICGVRFLIGGPHSVERLQGLRDGDVWQEDHLKSRVHEAYEQIRDALTEMRKKRREQEASDRKRSKSRSRSKGGRRSGDRDRRDGDRRDGDRRDRDRGRDRSRNRDRSRDRDRRDDRRDRSRDKDRRDDRDRRRSRSR